MSIKLKKHNEGTYEKIQEGFKRSKKVAVIQPTGTGKSFLALKLLEDNKDKKAIYIAPSNAILHNVKKNIFESEMDMSDFPNLERITYQKLMKLSDEEIEKLGADIVVIDEFHHCGATEWGKGVDRLLEKNPDAQVLGLSATPIRYFDYSRDMAEELFGDNIASEMTLEDAINSGILPRARYVSALYEFDNELERMQEDIDKIKDPEKKEQAQTMFNSLAKQVDENTGNIQEMLSEHMKEKNGKYIVFCKNIEDMQEKIKQAQSMFGKVNKNITIYSVSSKLHDNENTLKRFEGDNDEDTLKLMFAVDMLNEGYHINDLNGVIMMRPTYSPTIYAQQIGRALTVKDEDGKEPLIIDLVNNLDSIKIIEDLYERLRQYESTGEHKKDREQQAGLIIYDKTKEFRDVAKRISELSKREIVSLEEKIEIFERYLEEGNDDIDGLTVYEGKPIGQWAVQIRYGIKKGGNLTEDQLEKLDELGILERRIDSTLDEKIDALIEWKKKYPDVVITRENLNQPIGDETIKKLKELAQAEGIEFSEIEEKYKKIKSYNNYIRYRETEGALTEQQWNKCKEGNLGGKFGFSTEAEQLAKKLKIDVKQVVDIINNFGSMDNFIQMYKDGKLSMYNNKLITNMIDIDYNPLSQNYLRLVKEIFGSSFEFKLFSTDELNTAIEALNTREKETIQFYFGLIDGKCKTYKDLSKYFGVSQSAIGQTIGKTIRGLRGLSRLKPFTFEQLKENEYISDEETELLSDLENEILNSNLIFKHDSIDDLDFSKDKFDTIRDIQKNIKSRKEADQAIHKEKFAIEDMGLSVRSFNCLMRGNIRTLADLEKISYEELQKIRNLGKESALEIITKAKKYGVILEGTVDLDDHDADGTIHKEKFAIKDMGLSVRLSNCLKLRNINTLADLNNLSYGELLEIKGVGKGSALEIIAKAKKYGVILEGTVDLDDHDADDHDVDGTTTEENFPTEIEQLAEKLKIDVKQVADITNNFGSMDNFIQMYKDGKLSKGQTELYNNKLINNMIDIDYNPLAQNYLRLVKEIFGSSFEFKLFSTDELNTAIEALNTRDKEAIQLYFGLIDGKCKTYEDLSKYFDVPNLTIRGIISKAKGKLHHQSGLKPLKPFTFEQLKENEYISDEEIELLSDLENEILNSNLIFKHDSIDDLDFSKDKFDTIRNIQKNIESRKEVDKTINKEKFEIEDMGLSARSFNCLMRRNIRTLADLEKISYEELQKFSGVGKESALEIIAKAKKYGVTLEGAVDLYDHDADGTTTEAKHDEKVYSNSEFEEIRAKKTELEAELKELDEQTKKARELLVKYNKLISDDKLNTDDEAPDFKDE